MDLFEKKKSDNLHILSQKGVFSLLFICRPMHYGQNRVPGVSGHHNTAQTNEFIQGIMRELLVPEGEPTRGVKDGSQPQEPKTGAEACRLG